MTTADRGIRNSPHCIEKSEGPNLRAFETTVAKAKENVAACGIYNCKKQKKKKKKTGVSVSRVMTYDLDLLEPRATLAIYARLSTTTTTTGYRLSNSIFNMIFKRCNSTSSSWLPPMPAPRAPQAVHRAPLLRRLANRYPTRGWDRGRLK